MHNSSRISSIEHHTISGTKGKRIDKQVFWYIAETETMAVKISHEHQEHLWLDWEGAMRQLTHEESKGVLAAAHSHMKSIGKD